MTSGKVELLVPNPNDLPDEPTLPVELDLEAELTTMESVDESAGLLKLHDSDS